MDITIEKLPKFETKLSITLSEKDMQKYENLTLKHEASHMKVPGFRQGKVPLEVAKKNLNPQHLEIMVVEKAIMLSFQEAIREKKLHPLTRPKVDIKNAKTPFTYEATIAERPELIVKGINKISLKKEEVNITDKDVVSAIEEYRKKLAKPEKSTNPVIKSNKVEVDIIAKDKEGKKIKEISTQNHPCVVGDNFFIPEIEEMMIGMSEGEVKESKIKLPKDFKLKEYAGEEVNFIITIRNIENIILPEIDKDFILKLTGREMAESEFKEKVKGSLVMERENHMNQKLEKELFDTVIKQTEGDISDLLIEDELEHIVEEFTKQLESHGLELNKYLEHQGKSLDDFKNNSKAEAERRIRLRSGISYIIDSEQIKVEPKEIEEEYNRLKSYYNNDNLKQVIENKLMITKLINKFIK